MLSLSLLLFTTHQSPVMAKLPHSNHKFIVVAHRGDHVTLPENTIAAILQAAKDGADYAEIDLRTPKDGGIILMHDDKVDRTTTGHGPVSSFTRAELLAFQTRGTQSKELTENHVPAFEDVLKAAHGKINLYLDIKDVTPEQVKPYLDKYKMRRNVIAYVYSTEQRNAWKAALPDIPIITDGDVRDVETAKAWWTSCPCEIVDGNTFHHSSQEIAAYHALGAVVWPDIQNPGEAPKQWDLALKMGVDGLQTDHPEMLITYLKSIGRR